jgi:hypothetical protein
MLFGRRRGLDGPQEEKRFVESNRKRWQGARAIYCEGAEISVVRLSDRIEITDRGLRAECILLPTPGLTPTAPAQWSIFFGWQASTFGKESWRNRYVPSNVWFKPSFVDATLQLAARLHTSEGIADCSPQVIHLAREFGLR